MELFPLLTLAFAWIEERKRLHSELLNSLDNSSPKVKSVTETPSSWVQHVPENYADGELVLGMPATHSDPESSVVYGHEAKPSAAKPTAAPPSRQRNFSPSIPASPSRRQYLEPEGTVKSPPEVEPSTRWPSSALRPTSLKMPDIKERKGSIDGAIAVKEVEPAEPVEVEKPPPLAGENVMNVVLVAAECAPWSKTGGLGDVAGALPKALARRGHRVMVVAPRYKVYEDVWDTTVRKRYTVNGQDMEVGYFHCYMDGVDYVFIENGAFLHCGDNIYGGSREELVKRCILLCKAAVEAPWHVPCGGVTYGDSNLVFIANDWHTALLPVYLQAYYRDNGLMQFARAVLVLHNMAHQGRSGVDYYRELGLPDQYLENFKLFDPVGGEHMNILMAGIKAAHRLVAVSTGYAWEIQTEEGGWGLHNVIRDSAWKLRGVVNGIDDTEWGPSVDRFLTSDGYCHYDVDTLETGKAQCKAALQKELGLPVRPDVPLLGFIGRLDYQKGVDLIQDAKDWMMQQEIQLVMLGSGREDLENTLRRMEGEHRDKCRGWVGFSVKMAHRITAACDILLMPSRFEPCGLNQLYAMRYGTVPVVHAVGGLRDTVTPFDPYNDAGLGWTFDRADTTGLIHALGNAIYTYREYLSSFRDLQRRGMTQDLSWDAAAAQYEEVMVAAKYQW
ncbi:hypothetical protein CBR_g23365 [Chara braunii]|uniref:starch synthase n=1 Tax=Chara braunii TaxID=69332 RepID=A0A388L3Z7_CHABU|nr:hypothetical protein CBR_g23365 [Chara braunii]|eukprot:GBG77039.1 hypothetical protein CBR_g23365 [Chara braunii]